MMRLVRLQWFGHVEKRDENDCVKIVKHFEVEGRLPIGGPKKAWDEALSTDLYSKVLDRQIAYNCAAL